MSDHGNSALCPSKSKVTPVSSMTMPLCLSATRNSGFTFGGTAPYAGTGAGPGAGAGGYAGGAGAGGYAGGGGPKTPDGCGCGFK
ncbi:hypothetical protein GCM10011583_54140 [Streptomyces camponoticapitis]|uniref:Uncharacterized protein n=1 Tax=Streptomyces camponoticapitis TaxID=1616125 RepID=A0ABQ2EPE0_9ACTN|nr:hypothetical protein GCM10011583_54140 [Streptomyces camponoticapitis]